MVDLFGGLGIRAVAAFLKGAWAAVIGIFKAPGKVLKLEKTVGELEAWKRANEAQLEPVICFGIAWFPSKFEQGKSVPFCPACWGNGGKRTPLIVEEATAHWRWLRCSLEPTKHGVDSDMRGRRFNLSARDHDEAVRHAHDGMRTGKTG